MKETNSVMNDLSVKILSDITVFSKYAKYIPELKRRETWDEIVDRYINMMIKKYPHMEAEINTNAIFLREKKVLPSMRALQFAGPAIEKNEARLYNCCYLPIDDYRSFSEVMFLLLGGTGVGYSVQKHHVDQLPEIRKPLKERKYLVGDSIEGWADAVKALMKSYFGMSNTRPKFDYSDIRPKGAQLITAGGKAPGPEPLKECLFMIQQMLDRKIDGSKLTPLECHDILCHIANAVLAGGIRRAAMIAGFSLDDEEMLTCKYGNWWELNEQRGRANNSAIILRHKIKEADFSSLWKKIQASGSGEPGIYFSNDKEWFTNPCCEIALRPYQFCNLSTINVSDVAGQDDLNERARVAAFFGTLQAGFSDFHYLRDVWKKTTEKDALIGVSMTGIGSGTVLPLDLEHAADVVKMENERVAELLGINPAARTTAIKPEGTASLVAGSSSGIHAWHNDYYLRSIRLGKNEALYTYLAIYYPELIEDEYFRPTTQAVLRVPQKAPDTAILRTETALDLLERSKRFNIEWVRAGHRNGQNTHNVSCFSGDTKFITDKGLKKFSEFNDGDIVNVMNHLGVFVPATVKHFGKQKIWNLTVSNGSDEFVIKTTKNHIWFTANDYKRYTSDKADSILGFNLRKTYQLMDSKKIQLPKILPNVGVPKMNLNALLHGITFGDSTKHYKNENSKCSINLCHESRQLSKFFIEAGYDVIEKDNINQTYIGELPSDWKLLPNTYDADYLYWFIAGWFAADGHVTKDTYKRSNSINISHKDKANLEWLINIAPICGIATSRHIKSNIQKTEYKVDETYHSLSFVKITLSEEFFVMEHKRQSYVNQMTSIQSSKWYKVVSVEETDLVENVYCVVEPDNAAFVLEGYILTHNCTVSIKDDEWDLVGEWMWNNRDYYNGLSVLPFDNGSYIQAPFEDITKERYEELIKALSNVDLTMVIEEIDATDLAGEAACSAGKCEVV